MVTSTQDTLTALVAAALTVNQYPAERAWALMPAFREAGLLDPARVAPMPWDDLVGRIRTAGYDRGGFVPIVGARLAQLMLDASAGRLDDVFHAANEGKQDKFEQGVLKIKGFGPRVARTAWGWLNRPPTSF